jgi:hypothetical protein
MMSRDVKAWIPGKYEDHPRSITGMVVKVSTTISDYSDDPVPVLEILADDSSDVIWRVVAFATVLSREIAEQRPSRGDRIGIRYQGKVAGGKGEYESYRVAVERAEQPEESIDWAAIEAASSSASEPEPFPDESEPEKF